MIYFARFWRISFEQNRGPGGQRKHKHIACSRKVTYSMQQEGQSSGYKKGGVSAFTVYNLHGRPHVKLTRIRPSELELIYMGFRSLASPMLCRPVLAVKLYRHGCTPLMWACDTTKGGQWRRVVGGGVGGGDDATCSAGIGGMENACFGHQCLGEAIFQNGKRRRISMGSGTQGVRAFT